MARLRLFFLVFFIASCTHVYSDDSEEEVDAAANLDTFNPFGQMRGDNVQQQDLEDMEELEQMDAQELAEHQQELAEQQQELAEQRQQELAEQQQQLAEQQQELAEQEAERQQELAEQQQELAEQELERQQELAEQEQERQQELAEQQEGEEVEPPEMGDGESESSVFPSIFSSINGGGAMVNPQGQQGAGGDAESGEEEDGEAAAMGGPPQQTGGSADSESNEVVGGGGSIGGGSIGAMESTFTLAPQMTTGPPLVQDTTMTVATRRTPEPIRGDGVMANTAADTNEAVPAPQKMSKQKVAGIAAGAGTVGAVGIAAAGVGLAFKAGLIGGGGAAAAAGGGAGAV